MNDFTKEELQYFLERIDFARKHERDLFKKVKSMIDNYCEHEQKETVQTVNMGNTFTNQCKK